MPIYAYRCTSCGHAKDVLQKISDPLLSDCPACGAATFVKQVTAAGFQLKGSGWYVTDFRGGNNGGKAAEGDGPGPEKDGAKKNDPAGESAAEKGGEKGADKAASASSTPAAPAAPAAATAASTSASTSASAAAASRPAAAPPPAGG